MWIRLIRNVNKTIMFYVKSGTLNLVYQTTVSDVNNDLIQVNGFRTERPPQADILRLEIGSPYCSIK